MRCGQLARQRLYIFQRLLSNGYFTAIYSCCAAVEGIYLSPPCPSRLKIVARQPREDDISPAMPWLERAYCVCAPAFSRHGSGFGGWERGGGSYSRPFVSVSAAFVRDFASVLPAVPFFSVSTSCPALGLFVNGPDSPGIWASRRYVLLRWPCGLKPAALKRLVHI